MSGGFFRGTSADQDTRFSNKEAKLLKSKKFAPELDVLVDMAKVKMDIIRPWIAQRVTELLGFEDEVLINFIFGLLDGKDVDGKQIQIQLTGFMEKNTGRFMKELWTLLISAQNNVSGVPQQFLDAKEEETRKNKAEADRINQEIQQKREKDSRAMVQEHKKKLDGETNSPQDPALDPETISKDLLLKDHTKESNIEKRKSRERGRFPISPRNDEQSLSPHRRSPRQRSRSFSKSRSPLRSPSAERGKSRSISRSPRHRRHSPIERRSYSPVHSPNHKRSRYDDSPPRRRSPYLRRRPPSPIRRRSPSPVRRRSISPWRRRSPAFVRKRSPSPRRRSPSSMRRKPSPMRRRSPSPHRRRSPSPFRRRSPRYRRRSPVQSPRRHRVEASHYDRNRSRSPYKSHSPPSRSRRSLSRSPGNHAYGSEFRHHDKEKHHRMSSRRSPGGYSPNKDDSEYSSDAISAPESSARPPSSSLRSPQRDVKYKPEYPHDMSKLTHNDESHRVWSESPVQVQDRNLNEEMGKKSRGKADDPEGQVSVKVHGRSGHPRKSDDREYSPAAIASNASPENEDISEPKKNNHHLRSAVASPREEYPDKRTHLKRNSEEIEYGPGRPEASASAPQDRGTVKHSSSRQRNRDDMASGKRSGEKMKLGFEDHDFGNNKAVFKESLKRGEHGRYQDGRGEKMQLGFEDCDFENNKAVLEGSLKRVEHGCYQDGGDGSDVNDNKNATYYKDRKKQRREESERDDGDHDISGSDERRESKRRRKEEKKRRKEERRKKREERRQRRELREMKNKSTAGVSPDYAKNHNVVDKSDGEDGPGNSFQSDGEEEESEQKRLEIELRKKALESLRAKKAIH